MSRLRKLARRAWGHQLAGAILLYVTLRLLGAEDWQAFAVVAICMTIDNPLWRREPTPSARVIVEHRGEAENVR